MYKKNFYNKKKENKLKKNFKKNKKKLKKYILPVK